MDIMDNSLLNNFEIISEGLAKIYVPKRDLYMRSNGVYEPSWAPVFYNPNMRMNRDINILLLNTLAESSRVKTIIDLLTATGVRGIRIGLEVSGVENVILNDASTYACRLADINIKINKISNIASVRCEDARSLAYNFIRSNIHADYIDIDPYGSPIPFIEPSLKLPNIDGVIGITATDLAPLTGSHPWKTLKRYHSYIVKTDFQKEAGIRILIYNIMAKAYENDLDYGILLSYYSDHYYRVYIKRRKSSSRIIDNIYNNTGYILYCRKCLNRDWVSLKEYIDPKVLENRLRCPICGSLRVVIGPLWIGKIISKELVESIQRHIDLDKYSWLQSTTEIKRLIDLLINESKINSPYYYNLDQISRVLKINTPKVSKVIECLNGLGISSTRSHMDPKGVKTNASYREFLYCVKNLT